MDFVNRLIISYFTLLVIITSGVECSDESNESICQKLPNATQWTVSNGLGVKVDYHPYILYDGNYHHKGVNYTVYNNNPSENCSFTIEDDRYIVQLNAYQVSANKILIFLQSKDPTKYEIMNLDMNNCETKSLNHIVEKNQDEWGRFHYINNSQGIDVIIEKNNQTSEKIRYDFNGNQIGYVEPFFRNNEWNIPLLAINPFSTSSNLVADYVVNGTRFVSLLAANGQLIKHLLELDANDNIIVAKHVSDSLFACCWKQYDYGVVKYPFYCAQFDEFGERKYIGNITNSNIFYLDSRHLKDGGLVIFSRSNRYLTVYEMRPDSIYKKMYLVEDDFWHEHVVSNFNETARQFTIRTRMQYPEHKICWNTFDFPTKI